MKVPLSWLCELYDSAGQRISDGNGHTAAEAMALAWIAAWAPDALIDGRVEPGAVPFELAKKASTAPNEG
jgi:hypothetical protein